MSRDLEVGDTFNTKGYNMVAMMDCYEDDGGIILVMHNNSTHYLVAKVPEINVQMAIDDNPLEFDAILLRATSYQRATEEELGGLFDEVMAYALKRCRRRRTGA